MLLEKVRLLSKQKDVVSTFNKHFGSIKDSLNLLINSIIEKFASHLCIKAIKKEFKIKSKYSFNLVSTETIKRIINALDIKKASSGEIPTYLVILFWTLSQ